MPGQHQEFLDFPLTSRNQHTTLKIEFTVIQIPEGSRKLGEETVQLWPNG